MPVDCAAELAQPVVDTIDAHLIRHLIKEGVGGLLDRFGDVEHAVAGFQPVAVAAFGAGQRPGRRTEKVVVGVITPANSAETAM